MGEMLDALEAVVRLRIHPSARRNDIGLRLVASATSAT